MFGYESILIYLQRLQRMCSCTVWARVCSPSAIRPKNSMCVRTFEKHGFFNVEQNQTTTTKTIWNEEEKKTTNNNTQIPTKYTRTIHWCIHKQQIFSQLSCYYCFWFICRCWRIILSPDAHHHRYPKRWKRSGNTRRGQKRSNCQSIGFTLRVFRADIGWVLDRLTAIVFFLLSIYFIFFFLCFIHRNNIHLNRNWNLNCVNHLVMFSYYLLKMQRHHNENCQFFDHLAKWLNILKLQIYWATQKIAYFE